MMGRNVKRLYTSERTINIYKEDLKKGMYFIQVIDGNNRIVKKIILN